MRKRKTVIIEVCEPTPIREKKPHPLAGAKVVLKRRARGVGIDAMLGNAAHNECMKRAREFYEFLYQNCTGDFYYELKALMNKP